VSGTRIGILGNSLQADFGLLGSIAGGVVDALSQLGYPFNAAVYVLFMDIHAVRRMNIHHRMGAYGVRVATS